MQHADVQAVFADSWKSVEHLAATGSVPIVTWAHGNEFPRDHGKDKRISAALSKVNHVLVNSNETYSRLSGLLRAGQPYTLVHPPLDDAPAPTNEDVAKVQALWNGAHPRLLSMARLIDWKGIDRAIGAMPAVVARHPTARLVVAGVGDDEKRLKALVRDLNMEGHVLFAGWVEGGAKTQLLKTADIYVQPGRQVNEEREGYGISYAEAAAQGVPSISGNAGGAPEAVIDGETGVIVDGESQAQVDEAVLDLLQDDAKREMMSKAAKRHGENAHWRNQIKRVLEAADLQPTLNA